MPENANARLAGVYEGAPKFDDTMRQITLTWELEDGRKLYDNLTLKGGTEGARTRGIIQLTKALKAMLGSPVVLNIGEYNGKPSIQDYAKGQQQAASGVQNLETTFNAEPVT